MGRKPKTTGPRARDAGAFKSVLVRMNIEGWRALKVLAVEQEATLNALAVGAEQWHPPARSNARVNAAGRPRRRHGRAGMRGRVGYRLPAGGRASARKGEDRDARTGLSGPIRLKEGAPTSFQSQTMFARKRPAGSRRRVFSWIGSAFR